MKRYITFFLFFVVTQISLSHANNHAEGPTGNDLLKACQAVLTAENDEIDAMLCHWYTTPCDCDHLGTNIPRVCLPSGVDEIHLAKLIVDQLNNNQALKTENATYAANTILEKYYPCDE